MSSRSGQERGRPRDAGAGNRGARWVHSASVRSAVRGLLHMDQGPAALPVLRRCTGSTHIRDCRSRTGVLGGSSAARDDRRSTSGPRPHIIAPARGSKHNETHTRRAATVCTTDTRGSRADRHDGHAGGAATCRPSAPPHSDALSTRRCACRYSWWTSSSRCASKRSTW